MTLYLLQTTRETIYAREISQIHEAVRFYREHPALYLEQRLASTDPEQKVREVRAKWERLSPEDYVWTLVTIAQRAEKDKDDPDVDAGQRKTMLAIRDYMRTQTDWQGDAGPLEVIDDREMTRWASTHYQRIWDAFGIPPALVSAEERYARQGALREREEFRWLVHGPDDKDIRLVDSAVSPFNPSGEIDLAEEGDGIDPSSFTRIEVAPQFHLDLSYHSLISFVCFQREASGAPPRGPLYALHEQGNEPMGFFLVPPDVLRGIVEMDVTPYVTAAKRFLRLDEDFHEGAFDSLLREHGIPYVGES